MQQGSPAGAPPTPMVCIEHLNKSFSDKIAVEDLSFHVNPGEIFTLLGPNGAGKTTTLRMLMGVLRPSSGTASIGGFDCFSQRQQVMGLVGYVPDEPAFYEHLRGSELLDFVATMHGLPPAVGRQRCEHWVQRLDLGDALGNFAVSYSHGMKKKLALVAALIPQPRLLILDEPTNGLDPIATRALHQIMREQRESGTAILFSTHLLDQAQKLCDRVAVLHKARLAALGAMSELQGVDGGDASLEELFFRITGSADADPVEAEPDTEAPQGTTSDRGTGRTTPSDPPQEPSP